MHFITPIPTPPLPRDPEETRGVFRGVLGRFFPSSGRADAERAKTMLQTLRHDAHMKAAKLLAYGRVPPPVSEAEWLMVLLGLNEELSRAGARLETFTQWMDDVRFRESVIALRQEQAKFEEERRLAFVERVSRLEEEWKDLSSFDAEEDGLFAQLREYEQQEQELLRAAAAIKREADALRSSHQSSRQEYDSRRRKFLDAKRKASIFSPPDSPQPDSKKRKVETGLDKEGLATGERAGREDEVLEVKPPFHLKRRPVRDLVPLKFGPAVPDGNCGFRCIAGGHTLFGFDQSRWREVRQELGAHFASHKEIYMGEAFTDHRPTRPRRVSGHPCCLVSGL